MRDEGIQISQKRNVSFSLLIPAASPRHLQNTALNLIFWQTWPSSNVETVTSWEFILRDIVYRAKAMLA